MARVLGISIVICTPLFLASCAPDTARPEHSFRIYEEDGVTIAETTGGPKYEGELFQYEFLLTLEEDEREDSLLFNPLGFQMDENGWFYVNDYGNHRIAVFDREGRYSHAIGREGQGPGELRVGIIQSVRGGVVTVMDMLQRRVTRFQDDGTLIDVTGLTGSITSSLQISGYHFLPGDRRLTIGAAVDLTDPMQVLRLEDMAIRATVTGSSGDTIWTVSTPYVQVMESVMVKLLGQETPFPIPIPFGPTPSAAYHPEYGIVMSAGLKPEVDYLDRDGNVRMRAKIEMAPEVPTVEEREGILQSLQALYDEADDPMKSVYESQMQHLRMPESKALWGEVGIDDSGFTWLQLPLPSQYAASEDTTRSFRILSPDGEYLGITTRPTGGTQSIAHGRMLLQRSEPETGEYLLEVYLIRPAVDGLVYP